MIYTIQAFCIVIVGLPSAPSGMIITHHNLSYLSLSWTPGFTSFNVSTYHTVYSVSPTGTPEVIGRNASTHLLSPVLQECGSNVFRVYATNQAGRSIGFSETRFSGLISEYFSNVVYVVTVVVVFCCCFFVHSYFFFNSQLST